MATGKRASMREGPLADLFRKTSDDEPAQRPRRLRLTLPRRPSAPRPIRR